MFHAYRRLVAVKAVVCALVASSFWFPRSARAEPFELGAIPGQLGVVVYPAKAPGARSVTVLLHGMCGEPRRTCSHFAAEITESEHLICPRASQRCEGGGASWPGVGLQPQLEAAVSRAEAALAERVDTAPGRTLIGYSLGAFRALDVAQHGAGRYPRVMLLGARIQADPNKLRESGVRRLLLGAGAFDMTHDHMRREAQRVARGGVAARFLGLGQVGHTLTPSFAEYLPIALGWLQASED